MYRLLIVAFLLVGARSFAQDGPVIWIDLVKIKDGNAAEAMYFYENNWKVYRDSAQKIGLITSYKLLRNTTDTAKADILLVTEYPSRKVFEDREQYWQPLMKALRPNGPVVLNGKKRDEFLTIVDSYLLAVVGQSK